MNWLNNHLPNLMTGAVAGAIACTALLILYFLKLRRREMPISSTFLWKRAVQDLQVNAPFQKLRRNLLLLLQLLILIALATALMRPIMNVKQGAGKRTVILIDRSASMGAKDIDGGKRTRLEEARRMALDVVDSMGRDDHCCVIAFDETAETLCPMTTDPGRLRLAIRNVEQTDRSSRLKLAYQLAEAQARANYVPEARIQNEQDMPKVFLFSDGRTTDDAGTNVKGELVFEKIGQDNTPNVAVVTFSAARSYERMNEVQVFTRLANFGPEPVEVDVNLDVSTAAAPAVEFVQVRSARAFLLPARWNKEQRDDYEKKTGRTQRDSIDLKLELTTGAVLRVQHNAASDALAADNAACVVLPAPRSQSVLLVTSGNYFLERIKDSLQNLKQFKIVTGESYEQERPQAYDVIIFDRHDPIFMPQAGSFVYFNCLPPGLRVQQARDEGKPAFIHKVSVLDWKRDHPMLRGLIFNRLYVEDAMKLEAPASVERLIDGNRGPLVLLWRESRGTHLLVGFDILQSNWPLKVSFPMFMYNAMQYLSLGGELEQKMSLPTGATPALQLVETQRAAAGKNEITVHGPWGSRRVSIPSAGELVLPSMDRVGLYALNVSIPDHDRFAVNLLDSNESNLMTAAQAPGTGGLVTNQVQAGKRRMELWWWLALAALPLLLVEWWVYTRRIHL